MAGRGTVNRVVQVGPETVYGTPVSASKQLPSMSFTLSRTLEPRKYRSQGYKSTTTSKINKDYGGGTLSGPVTYTDIVYPLSTLVTPVITTPSGGTNSRDWTFTIVASGTDAFKSLTIQEGDANRARQMAGAILTTFGINYGAEESTVTGTVLGKTPTTATLTASPTAIAQLPGGPREVDFFMDAIGGTIGTTAVTDFLFGNFNIANKQAPKWVQSTSQTSFKETVEVPINLTAQMVTEDNAQSAAFYDAITSSSNPVKLCRFQHTGPTIEGSIKYKVRVDFAAPIIGTEQTDADGVWGYQYQVDPEYNATFGNKLCEIVVTNTLTAL